MFKNQLYIGQACIEGFCSDETCEEDFDCEDKVVE